jgi:hypothetical protein
MTPEEEELVRIARAAWNNVPPDHPVSAAQMHQNTLDAWLRVVRAVLKHVPGPK